MRTSTENVFNWLNHKPFLDQLEIFKNTNPGYEFNETSIEKAIETFSNDRLILISCIQNNQWDEVVNYQKRIAVHNSLAHLVTSLSNMERFGFQASHPQAGAMGQAIIINLNTFADSLENTRIAEDINGYKDYKIQASEIQKVKSEYESLIQEIKKARDISVSNQEINEGLKSLSADLSQKLVSLEEDRSNLLLIKDEISATAKQVSSMNQDIENKKVQITAFHANIREYEKVNDKLQEDAKNLLAKDTIISGLINQAENALSLKSAEGISAAFSAHYIETSKKWVLQGWLGGAILFIGTAILLTAWIVSNDDSDNLNALIGRIVAVGISITGATFCAKQFIKQKNILEDYAYKSVLAKSIIAFTEEIKKRDDKKVAAYLEKVLGEIHRDPLRGRDDNNDKNIGLNANEVLEKITTLINKKSS